MRGVVQNRKAVGAGLRSAIAPAEHNPQISGDGLVCPEAYCPREAHLCAPSEETGSWVARTQRKMRVMFCGGYSYRLAAAGVSIGFAVAMAAPRYGHAYFSGCIANITPDTMNVGTSAAFTVSITNGLGSAIQWVDVTVPSSGNYNYQNSIVTGGWVVGDHGDGVYLEGGDTIDNGATWSFQVAVSSGVQTAGPEAWTVRASITSDGQNPQTCLGSLSTSITGQLPQDQVNGVSNVVVSDITKDAATVSWQTDNPSSGMVYYGLTASYGQHTALESSYTTQHSARITGLSADTTYHYQVVGTDGNGSYAYSMDNTFVTAKAPVVIPPSNPSDGEQPLPAPSKPPQVSQDVVNADKEPPAVIVATRLASAYPKAPTISGTATDNVAVKGVEYSTDGGKNWLPVDVLTRVGTKVTFSFTPLITADGNYEVAVRATDMAGQTAVSASQTLVIDQLPPLVGGNLVTIGPETIRPTTSGAINTVMGQDVRLVMSAVGGPTSIAAEGVSVDQQSVTQSFSLTQSPDTGLWSGVLDFAQPGTYRLTAKAQDGAGNKTEKLVAVVHVAPSAKVTDAGSNAPVQSATVEVQYRDPETQNWTRWEAGQYDQANPLTVGKDGSYGLYLPAGTYYLKFRAPGYSETNTKSFTLDQPTVVSTNVGLRKRPGIHLGKLHLSIPWVEVRLATATFDRADGTHGMSQDAIIGNPLPATTLPLVDGTQVRQTELFGKPSILTVVSTWAPAAQDQLAILNQLDRKQVHVYAIGAGENAARMAAYMRIAGYNIPVIADPQNKLTTSLGTAGLPTTYFLDRHGVVRHVVTGVLSKDELLEYAVYSM